MVFGRIFRATLSDEDVAKGYCKIVVEISEVISLIIITSKENIIIDEKPSSDCIFLYKTGEYIRFAESSFEGIRNEQGKVLNGEIFENDGTMKTNGGYFYIER